MLLFVNLPMTSVILSNMTDKTIWHQRFQSAFNATFMNPQCYPLNWSRPIVLSWLITHDDDKLTLYVLVYIAVSYESLTTDGMSTQCTYRGLVFHLFVEVAYKSPTCHVVGGWWCYTDFLFIPKRYSYHSSIPVIHLTLWGRCSTIEFGFVKGICRYWFANTWYKRLFHLV